MVTYLKDQLHFKSSLITQFSGIITKTRLYNFDPLKPHFYIVKLGFTGVYIIFLISVQNIDCGYSLEPPRRGGSNEYPQSMFWAEIWKISEFLSENFQFLVVKFSICLNRRVFVMEILMESLMTGYGKSSYFLISFPNVIQYLKHTTSFRYRCDVDFAVTSVTMFCVRVY